jgi:hypothetical protein
MRNSRINDEYDDFLTIKNTPKLCIQESLVQLLAHIPIILRFVMAVFNSSRQIYQVKVKQSCYMPWRRLGERRCSSFSFTTTELDGGEWSASRLSRTLPLGKGHPVPTGQQAGWAPEPDWAQRIKEKSFAPARDRTTITWLSSP